MKIALPPRHIHPIFPLTSPGHVNEIHP